MKRELLFNLFIALIASMSAQNSGRSICVSDNHRFLQKSDGSPFFYLGDTAWELFHRLDKDEAEFYLQDRVGKGFNVIQAVLISEFNGVETPNVYGRLPITDHDPSRPAVIDGEYDYWDHVDCVVAKANSLGLTMAILPTWGSYWGDTNKKIFNEKNAETYGQFLGNRYKDADIIWVLGGDRRPETEEQKQIIRAMARGLKKGDGGCHLITFHACGWHGSAQFFNGEDWLDFNMRQNGHSPEYRGYSNTLADYNRYPDLPVIDGEPLYEDHPIDFKPDERGHSIAADVRRALYWDLFNGACGHTYGHHSVWQMYNPEKGYPQNRPLLSWRQALNQPGACQVHHARNLMLSRPYFSRIPATDEVLGKGEYPSSMPGEGLYRFVATRDVDSTYIMVYAPVDREFTVNTGLINDDKIKVWWFNPRTGKSQRASVINNTGTARFSSPANGEYEDWILVLDSKKAGYKAPGTQSRFRASLIGI